MRNRQSNFELLRLIAMLMILGLHANFLANGTPQCADFAFDFSHSYFRFLCQCFMIVGVDVFVLISGWFGINLKLKGIFNILYHCFFYTIAGVIIVGIVLKQPIVWTSVIKYLYFGGAYWFVPAYIGLMILSPILNNFVQNADRQQVLFFLMAFMCFQILLGWVGLDEAHFINGYSAMSFIWLYIFSRYVRIYRPKFSTLNKYYYLFIYVLLVVCSCTLLSVALRYGGSLIGMNVRDKMMAYNSPLVIAGAMSLVLFFDKLEIGVSRAINYLAESSFAIYIIHSNAMVGPVYKKFMRIIFERYDSVACLLMMILGILAVALVCILIDKVRLASWNLILRKCDKNH